MFGPESPPLYLLESYAYMFEVSHTHSTFFINEAYIFPLRQLILPNFTPPSLEKSAIIIWILLRIVERGGLLQIRVEWGEVKAH